MESQNTDQLKKIDQLVPVYSRVRPLLSAAQISQSLFQQPSPSIALQQGLKKNCDMDLSNDQKNSYEFQRLSKGQLLYQEVVDSPPPDVLGIYLVSSYASEKCQFSQQVEPEPPQDLFEEKSLPILDQQQNQGLPFEQKLNQLIEEVLSLTNHQRIGHFTNGRQTNQIEEEPAGEGMDEHNPEPQGQRMQEERRREAMDEHNLEGQGERRQEGPAEAPMNEEINSPLQLQHGQNPNYQGILEFTIQASRMGNGELQNEQTIPESRFTNLNQQNEINTCRNSHKVYHTVFKNHVTSITQNPNANPQITTNFVDLPQLQRKTEEYNRYFNQRVYFVLMLEESVKHIRGQSLCLKFEELVRNKIQKRQEQADGMDPQCEQAQHLRRLIRELEFAILACREFVDGNKSNALTIVYKRHQTAIHNQRKFQQAIQTVFDLTGLQLHETNWVAIQQSH